MKHSKKLVTAAVIASMSLLTACDGDEGDTSISGDNIAGDFITGDKFTSEGGDQIISTGDGSGTPGTGTPGTGVSDCPDWTSPLAQTAGGVDQCELPGSISTDRTLTSDKIWILDQPTLVGNGNFDLTFDASTGAVTSNIQNVVFSIEAGTRVKANTGAYLVITRGSQIRANGTATAPIIMSGNGTDDPTDGSGEWGGIVLQGFGANNNCPTVGTDCNVNGEGNLVDFKWGGYDNADSSGVMTYVIVTEAGFEVSPDNELNGIGFMGVGSGTTVNHIQVHNNADDGVEFWGGAVNVSHMVLTSNQDDSIDWDEGYQGNIQFAIVKHDTNGGDHGIEADNGGPSNTATPVSKPTLANITFIGAGTSSDDAFNLKKGTGMFLHNSVVSGFADCIYFDDTDVQGRLGTELFFNNLTLDCTTAYSGSNGLSAAVLPGAQNITEEAAAVDANYASQAASASLGAVVDLDAVVGTSLDTADGTFLTDTDYAGAVDPAGSDDWFSSWIIGGL